MINLKKSPCRIRISCLRGILSITATTSSFPPIASGFALDEDVIGKRLFIDFDGVMLMCTVYLNGKLLGVHKGGYTPFSFEITENVRSGENVLTVYVDATEDKNIPPYGHLVDYLTFGGIYRDVFLRLVEPCHMVSVFVRPNQVLTSPELDCDIELAQWSPGLTLEATLEDERGTPSHSTVRR